jgi:hypothetical protein
MFLYVPHYIHLFLDHILLKWHLKQLPHIGILPILASLGKPILFDVPAYRCDYHAHEVAIGQLGFEMEDRVVFAQGV